MIHQITTSEATFFVFLIWRCCMLSFMHAACYFTNTRQRHVLGHITCFISSIDKIYCFGDCQILTTFNKFKNVKGHSSTRSDILSRGHWRRYLMYHFVYYHLPISRSASYEWLFVAMLIIWYLEQYITVHTHFQTLFFFK
jgi:hypothetical protein